MNANAIRQARLSLGLTQAQFAESFVQNQANLVILPLKAESDTRNAVGTLLEVTLFESNILGVIDNKCGPVVVLFEPKAAVEKTDISYVAEVRRVSRYRSNLAGEPLVVLLRIKQSLRSRVPALGCDPDIL